MCNFFLHGFSIQPIKYFILLRFGFPYGTAWGFAREEESRSSAVLGLALASGLGLDYDDSPVGKTEPKIRSNH